MNYLAHAFLSLNDAEIMVGNLMGDFIKGKQYLQYEGKIRQGMLLHRRIDFYTDTHPVVLEATALLKPELRLRSAIFLDILFDHFLANDARYFDHDSLKQFTGDVYAHLDHYREHFNEPMRNLFAHMATHNWLYHYRMLEGLERSIRGICRRYPILGSGDVAMGAVLQHYDALNTLYRQFFPELHQHVLLQT